MQRILRDPTQRDPRPTTPPLRGASDPAERSHTTPTRQIAGPARRRHRCSALLAVGALLCSTLVVTATGGPVAAATGDISLVGGFGPQSYAGDCVPVTEASLSQPQAMAVGPDGTTAIVMPSRNMVLRVDEGVARIVGGTGTASFTADGALAAVSPLNNPDGIAVDSNGDLLVAERGTHRIRRIDSDTGVLSTVAGDGTSGSTGDGGPATAARLSAPTALSVDADDNLYIVDNSTRIRRVDATTGVITTIASGFTNVRGVAASSDSSRVYFSQNQTIQAYTTSTNTVKVLAGSTAGYGGDGGPSQSALLNTPRGLAVDAAGHLFIADTGNHRIRRIDTATEIITTVAGNGTAGFTQGAGPPTDYQLNLPHDVALTAAGDLRIADLANLRVRGIVSGRLLVLAGDGAPTPDVTYCLEAHLAQFSNPSQALGDGAGGIYVADTGNHRVRRIDTTTGHVTTIAGTGANSDFGDTGPATAAGTAGPRDLAWDRHGNLLVATSSRVRSIDLSTGTITTFAGTGFGTPSGDGGPATAAILGNVRAIAHDPQGRLVIGIQSQVRRVALDGTISTIAGTGINAHAGDGGPATEADLSELEGVAVDPAGNVWTSHRTTHRIRRIEAATGIITTAAGIGASGSTGDGGPATAARLSNPMGLVADAGGNVYVADRSNDRIRRIDATTGYITTVAGNGGRDFVGDGGPATAAHVAAPTGVSLAPDGDLLITTEGVNGQHRVRRVEGLSPTGYLRVTTSPALPATISVNGIPRDSWGLTWLELPTGTHQVCFGAVDRFIPPPCQDVLIAPDQTTTSDGAYSLRGYLRVTTTPAVPATITVDGVPRNDWGLWTEVDPGTYDVCFGGVADLEEPPCQQATVVAGDVTHIEGAYTELPGKEGPQGHGYLRATTNPATGSRITIDGHWTDSWGLTWLKLDPDTYEVCFDDTLYRTRPDCQDVKIEADQTEVLDGTFTPRGFLQVSTSPAVPATIYVDGHRANTWGVYTTVAPGPHTVCFGAMPSGALLPPPCQHVTVEPGATTAVIGTYQ